MKLNSAQLEAFFSVARLRNFTRAAEALHVTQSALSQRIAKLEEDLEITLFIRERASVRLTDAGEQVLRFCQLNETAESELLSTLKDTRADFAGALRVGGFSSVNRSMVIPALRRIAIENPRLSIHLMTKEVRELEDLLRRSEVDYIITTQATETTDIQSVFLGYEENVLVRSKKYPNQDIFLDHDKDDPTTRGYLAHNKLKIKPSNRRFLDDVYGLIDGVKNGYGKAVLPLHLIAHDKDLEVEDPKKMLKVGVYLQFYAQPYYRGIHSRVLAEIESHFQKHFSGMHRSS